MVTLLSRAHLMEAAMSQEELMQVSWVVDIKSDQPPDDVVEDPPKKVPRPRIKKEKPHLQGEQLRLL